MTVTTVTTEDIKIATSHETRLDRHEISAAGRGSPTGWSWVEWLFLGIPVLMAASGLGLLLEAIVDTLRYGHPR